MSKKNKTPHWTSPQWTAPGVKTDYVKCECGDSVRRAGFASHKRGAQHQRWLRTNTLAAEGWANTRTYIARDGFLLSYDSLVAMLVTARFPVRHIKADGGFDCVWTRTWVLDLLMENMSGLREAEPMERFTRLLELLTIWRENHRDRVISEWEGTDEYFAGVLHAIHDAEDALGLMTVASTALPHGAGERVRDLLGEISACLIRAKTETQSTVAARKSARDAFGGLEEITRGLK